MWLVKNKKKIVILGSGFAAVECAKKLENEYGNNPEIELVMIGEDNFLLFTPKFSQLEQFVRKQNSMKDESKMLIHMEN